MVSIAPLRFILAPIVGDAEIHVITPPGASPHTYEPKPSDAQRVAAASTLLYVDDSLDGWVTKLSAPHAIAMLPLVPMQARLPYAADMHEALHEGEAHVHETGTTDPHFWSDPMVVAHTLDPLVEQLSQLHPEHAAEYRNRAAQFKLKLQMLDDEAAAILKPVQGNEVAVFHHSIDYLLHRYGIPVAGAVEPSPGQTSGPRTLQELALHLKALGVKAVFTEPQLPPQPAYAVAEEAGAKVVEIDPNGGVPGRETYEEWLLWNARQIRNALE